MKKSTLALLLLAACSPKVTTTTTPSPIGTAPSRESARNSNLTGASSPRAAVEEFLTAVHAQDIQGMSVIFGTSHGPSRDNMNHDELEKRLVILQCYFNHDKFRILGESPGEGRHRVVEVELTRQGNLRTPSFYAISGPGGRWYIDNMEIAAVRDFCRKS